MPTVNKSGVNGRRLIDYRLVSLMSAFHPLQTQCGPRDFLFTHAA